ncbi:MAG: hypothetical protein OXH05_12550 [Acidobacteria bacterium]|nr:hypothetical protein [Acidobacteriota bacterium]
MYPWKVSVGLTVAVVASLVFVAAARFDYLSPHRRLILTEHWWPVFLHAGSFVLTIVVALAGVLRSLGLYDVGRKVDLVERSVRRGDGDPELARRLHDQEHGDFAE